MSDKPRRPFQIHLSTAIVLMFVAGGLIGTTVIGNGWPVPFSFTLRGGSTFFQTINMVPNVAFLILDASIPVGIGLAFYFWLRSREARAP